MTDRTKIEWADATFNPAMGCTPISAGCKNCYARRMMGRYKGRKGWPDSPDTVTLYPERLEQPFHWRKPRRVFVNSMSDLFHDDVPFGYINAVFGVMAANIRHTFLVLTKRPKRMLEWFDGLFKAKPWLQCRASMMMRIEPPNDRFGPMTETPWPLPNVHIGVSVEDQETANYRIPLLLQTPAVKRFISAEPLLGPVNFDDGCNSWLTCKGTGRDQNDGYCCDQHAETGDDCFHGIDQIICGAETGPGARPMDLDWARSVRDQCLAAGTAFFFKKDSNGNRELDGKMWEEI